MLPMELQNAKFIWLSSLVEEVNTYVLTRETVTKTSGKRYLFAVTADSDYALFVGDRLVTGRQYADYPFYKVYDLSLIHISYRTALMTFMMLIFPLTTLIGTSLKFSS